MRLSTSARPRVCTWLVVPLLIALLFCLPLATSCAVERTTAGDLTQGVWRGEGGPDRFYWEFWVDGEDYGGVVHTVRDGKKQSELPVTKVSWQPPMLEMEMAATGAGYRGRVDLAGGKIRGGLRYGDKAGPDMELVRVDPEGVAGLRARPDEGGIPPAYVPPATMADGLATVSCEAVGIPREAVESLVADLIAGRGGVIHSLLLLREGKLFAEEYFHGYGPTDLHRLASVTKSVSSLLVGLAIDAGDIAGVDAPLLDFFPGVEQPDEPAWRAQTLRHVLTMSMGLDWDAEGGPHGTGPEHFRQVFARQVIHPPGSVWAYHSANVNLLAGVLKESTGLHADVFSEQQLFDPLEITDYDWSSRASDGYRLMDGSLWLRPRDMAKLGLLLRDEGRWRGEHVISADWIAESIRAQIPTGDGPEDYGYLWWLGILPTPTGTTRVIFANGRGSQFISWFPDLDLIAVVTGGNEDNGKHFAVGGLLAEHIIPRL